MSFEVDTFPPQKVEETEIPATTGTPVAETKPEGESVQSGYLLHRTRLGKYNLRDLLAISISRNPSLLTDKWIKR